VLTCFRPFLKIRIQLAPNRGKYFPNSPDPTPVTSVSVPHLGGLQDASDPHYSGSIQTPLAITARGGVHVSAQGHPHRSIHHSGFLHGAGSPGK
jgi:hypothetical protein